MPTYEFINKTTEEVFVRIIKYSEKVQYLNDNPNIESYFSKAPPLAYRIGAIKIPGGFKEVLSNIHERTGGSTLKNNTTGNL